MEFEEIKSKFSIKEKKILKSFNTFQNKFNSCQGGDFYLWGYDKIYDKYLKNIKNKSLKICEIGILEGYKLFIMSNYFTNCELYGYDIDISYFKYFNETFKNKIKNIQKINSTNNDETKNILEFFDVIIDDGDHRPNSIILTFKNFYSKLNKNGIYIIEDVTLKRKNILENYFIKNNIKYKYELNHNVKEDPLVHGLIIIKK